MKKLTFRTKFKNLPMEINIESSRIDPSLGLVFMYKGVEYAAQWDFIASLQEDRAMSTIEQTNAYIESLLIDNKKRSSNDSFKEYIAKYREEIANAERISIDYIDLSGLRVQIYLFLTKGEEIKQGRYKIIFSARRRKSKDGIMFNSIGDNPVELFDAMLSYVEKAIDPERNTTHSDTRSKN